MTYTVSYRSEKPFKDNCTLYGTVYTVHCTAFIKCPNSTKSLRLLLYTQYRAGTTVEGCQAGGLGHLLQYRREYNSKSPKQGRKRFNSIVKTIHFSYLPIIYL